MATRPRTDAVRRAQAKYDKANTRQYILKLNKKTDAELIAFLDALENRSGTLKQLIRDHLDRTEVAAANEAANERANEREQDGERFDAEMALGLLLDDRPANEDARLEVAEIAARAINARAVPLRIARSIAEAYIAGHKAAYDAMRDAARSTR